MGFLNFLDSFLNNHVLLQIVDCFLTIFGLLYFWELFFRWASGKKVEKKYIISRKLDQFDMLFDQIQSKSKAGTSHKTEEVICVISSKPHEKYQAKGYTVKEV